MSLPFTNNTTSTTSMSEQESDLDSNVIPTILSGKDFNKTFEHTKFYKFLNDDMIHNNFKYVFGLNVDTASFNPEGKCEKGGLYFCEESQCCRFWKSYGSLLALVKIPDDAQVYIEKNKFKADKIILTDIIHYNNVFDEFWAALIPNDGKALFYIRHQTEGLCRSAVKQNGMALQYVKEEFKTYDLCRLAVRQNYFALRYIKEEFKTDELRWLAAEQQKFVVRYDL